MTYAIRAATARDYPAYARLFPELRVPDPVPHEARYVEEMVPTSLVAEEGGEVLGFAFFQILTGTGYVRTVMVAPGARRRGIGRKLMTEVAARLRAAGCVTWCLNTYPDNTESIPLYESLGMRRVYLSKALTIDWATVAHAAARDVPGLRARAIAPEDDAAAERATGILPGQLALARAKGRVLVLLEETSGGGVGAVVGAAIFDPAFPGAYPFKVARPDLALVLLAALRPHARHGDTFVHVVIEDRVDVVGVLLAAGATVRMETVHLRGPL